MKFSAKVLSAMRKFPAVLLPLPLGEVASRSDDGEGANVLSSCIYHIFIDNKPHFAVN